MTGVTDTQPIINAASIVLVDWSPPEPRILMGLRRPDAIFMPNMWVFPGGRVESSDASIACCDDMRAEDAAVLSLRPLVAVPADFAKSIALAAVRELFEETGYAVAVPAGGPKPMGSEWPAFSERQLLPSLAPLHLFARAITPPGRPRRYDTRFFIANRDCTTHHPDARDGEFADTNWVTMAEAPTLDLPAITRMLLGDIENCLKDPHFTRSAPVPFYYEDQGIGRRDLLTRLS